jgi:hypothetical protein
MGSGTIARKGITVVHQDVEIHRRDASIEEVLRKDVHVQYEFDQLSRFLEEISDFPLDESPATSDPLWPIPENNVSRWVITLEGEMQVDRVSVFRKSLLGCQNVVDARVHNLMDGHICIRLVTTGGIQMGPVEQALSILRDPAEVADHLTVEPISPLAPA